MSRFEVSFVDPDTVRGWVEAGQAVVVDVREACEFAQGHVPGAHSRPLSTFDPAQLPPLAAGQHLVLNCLSGLRCGSAAQRLQRAGYQGVVWRLRGGVAAWAQAGGPLAQT